MRSELDTYDWQEAFGYAGEPDTVPGSTTSPASFTREDVAEILLMIEGQNEGPDWVGIFRLNDGRYVHLEACCDYTGWDCQAGGSAFAADSLDEVTRMGLSQENRRRALTNEPSIISEPIRDMIKGFADILEAR